MRRIFNNVISVIFSLIKFSILKIFNWNNFHFHIIERFSPNVDVYFIGKGKITLGKKIRVHSNSKLRAVGKGEIIIEDNTSINYGCMLTSQGKIHIGKNVTIAPNTLIYDHDHDVRVDGGVKSNKFIIGEVYIGENSWIGANTVILKNTRIGANCVVAAGSVISGTYPDNSLIIQKREITVKKIMPRI